MKNLTIGICIIVSGCMAPRIDLVSNKRVTITTQKPKEYWLNASAYEQDGQLRVLGRVSKNPLSFMDVRGHVDVEVLGPQGDRIARLSAPLRSLPAARHTSKPASFGATLQLVPPDGSTVLLSYNPQAHFDSEEL